MAAVDPLRGHYQIVARRLAAGKVIPFLGAGANLCGYPERESWLEHGLLPSGGELAEHLATAYAYPEPNRDDLLRVAQYVDMAAGEHALYEELRAIFARLYAPNPLHMLLAELPGRLRAGGRPAAEAGAGQPHDGPVAGQLIITTNYDDTLERAFADAGEPVDVVHYVAAPTRTGHFVHTRPDGTREEITRHAEYSDFDLRERSVICKIHGAVDRNDDEGEGDSYVITEDHYIDYLASASIGKLIPSYLMARMRASHFLFLGYGLRDWNLRVILRSIRAEQVRDIESWAVQRGPSDIDLTFWASHNVRILDLPLEDWVAAMQEQLP